MKIGKYLVGICTLLLFIGILSTDQMASQPSPAIYLVGRYGYLQKLDRNLNVVTTEKVPNLLIGYHICDADISPDGERLFLAVAHYKNPLVVMRSADLSVDENVRITFPPPFKPFRTYEPLIIAASSSYLYMTDEAYTSASPPYSTVLVDLNTKIAKPIYGYGFMSKTQIQISPNRDKMALNRGGKLYFIDISTGEVIDTISKELISKNKMIRWFNVNWKDNTAELYLIPIGESQKIEKVCIDVKSHRIIYRDPQKWKRKFALGMWDKISYRRILTATSSRRYIQDRKGNIQIFDRKTGKLLERLDYTLFEKAPGQPVVSYISPDDKLLFYRKDGVKQISGKKEYISWLCVMDIKTKQIVKTLQFPQRIVTVLFSE